MSENYLFCHLKTHRYQSSRIITHKEDQPSALSCSDRFTTMGTGNCEVMYIVGNKKHYNTNILKLAFEGGTAASLLVTQAAITFAET